MLSRKENVLQVLDGEMPEFLPVYIKDFTIAFLKEFWPSQTGDPYGVKWVPDVSGDMVDPHQEQLKDINDWRDRVHLPDIDKSLGIFIPLIVVNCIILGRAEAFACKNSPMASIFDGIGIGLGFTMALTLLGTVREIFGAGSCFGITLLPETTNILLFVLPPGAFISLGFLIAIMNRLNGKTK